MASITVTSPGNWSVWKLRPMPSLARRCAGCGGGARWSEAEIAALRAGLRKAYLEGRVAGKLNPSDVVDVVRAWGLEVLAKNPADVRAIFEHFDFAATVERISDDETGTLVDTFNDMLSEINRRDATLADHRRDLEATVEQRTHELSLAKNAAEAANHAKSGFLATMSHEIRTPMNGLMVMAELLAAGELDHRQQRYAEVIVKSGQSLLTIINDILDLSKIEAGKLDLEAIDVDPVAIDSHHPRSATDLDPHPLERGRGLVGQPIAERRQDVLAGIKDENLGARGVRPTEVLLERPMRELGDLPGDQREKLQDAIGGNPTACTLVDVRPQDVLTNYGGSAAMISAWARGAM